MAKNNGPGARAPETVMRRTVEMNCVTSMKPEMLRTKFKIVVIGEWIRGCKGFLRFFRVEVFRF